MRCGILHFNKNCDILAAMVLWCTVILIQEEHQKLFHQGLALVSLKISSLRERKYLFCII